MSDTEREIEDAMRLLGSLLQTFVHFSFLKQGMLKMSAELDAKIAKLQADVTAQTAANQSAVTLLGGLKTQLDDAIQAAIDAGATAEELQELTDLSTAIEANTQALSDAVVTNTPATPPQPASPNQPGAVV